VNEATWKEVAKQLASDNPNVYEDALKRMARRPLFMKQLQSALIPLAGYVGGQFGAAATQ
jgi:hypothetical protein